MKAVVLKQYGGVEHFHLVEKHEIIEPKAGQVLIRIRAVGFNPVDYKIRKGNFGGDVPRILGADFAGDCSL